MKRLVFYKLNFESKWLTFSGVMMGFAFFLQALDYFALRQLQTVGMWNFLLFLVFPMVLEALWCVPLRSESWRRAEVHGIFAVLISLVLLGQCILMGGVFPIVMGVLFSLLCGAAALLITWGFVPHKALGMLVCAVAALVRILVYVLPHYNAESTCLTLVRELPPVFMILSMMLFFGGLQIANDE